MSRVSVFKICRFLYCRDEGSGLDYGCNPLCQWFAVIQTVFRSPSVATFLTQNRAGMGPSGQPGGAAASPCQVHGPNARPFSGLKAPHEPRRSRREEARSFSHIGSQSLLTSAATVQGFNARSFVSEKFNGRPLTQPRFRELESGESLVQNQLIPVRIL